MTIDEAIDHLYTYSSTLGSGQTTQDEHEEAKRVAIDTMRKYLKLERGLDKISAEIENLYSYADFDEDTKTCYNMVRLEEVQRVIDKYKARK